MAFVKQQKERHVPPASPPLSSNDFPGHFGLLGPPTKFTTLRLFLLVFWLLTFGIQARRSFPLLSDRGPFSIGLVR